MSICPECGSDSYDRKEFSDGSIEGKCWSCEYTYYEPPDPVVDETDENWVEQLQEEEKSMLLEDSKAQNEEELIEMADKGMSMEEILER